MPINSSKIPAWISAIFLLASCQNTGAQSPGTGGDAPPVTASSTAVSNIVMTQRMKEKLAGRYDDVSDYADGFSTVIKDGKYTFVDTTGKELMPPQFELVSNFENGYASVKRDGAWGVINREGKDVFPFHKDWDYLATPVGGWMSARTVQGKSGFVNMKGETVIPFVYDDISVYEFAAGVAIVKKGGKYGLINKQNTVIAPFVYDYIHEFDGSTSVTPVQKGKRYGILRKDGTLTHPMTMAYDEVGAFSSGMATVKKGDLMGYIDTNGREVIAPKYSNASGFYDLGYAPVHDGKEGWLIDRAGAPVLRNHYWQVQPVAEDRFVVSIDEGAKMGIVTREGKEVWPMVYDNIMQMGDGIFLVHRLDNDATYYADISGKKVANYHPSGE